MLLLAFSLIEIIVLLVLYAVKSASSPSTATPQKRESCQAANQAPTQHLSKQKKELTDKQREQIVKAILDDSLLVMDRAYDALFNEGEAVFPAPEALSCSYLEFNEQYGSRKWKKAWEKALAERFDCKCKLVSNGNFHLYDKDK